MGVVRYLFADDYAMLQNKQPCEYRTKNAVIASDKNTQYDKCAKRLLSHKNVLAHILVKTIDEFKDMNPDDAVPYIIGTPYISKVPTELGLTNTANQSEYKKKADT